MAKAASNETAFPAKAGTHSSKPETVDKWVPAFAGNADFFFGKLRPRCR
jgi:hypothetical protein